MATAQQRPASLEDHPISRRTYRILTIDRCLSNFS